MRHLSTSVAMVVCLALAPRARAEDNPHLARARAELNELRYDKAKEALEQALRWGKSSPSETAEIHRLSGEVLAAFGDAKEAERAFARLLAIDPTVRLGAGVSPRISGPFNAALKSAQSKGPIKIRHETKTGDSPSVTLIVEADPHHMVKGARASLDGGDVVEEKGKGRIELALPPSPRLSVTVAAIDEHGNRIAELGRDQPIVIVSETAVAPGGGEGGPEGGEGGGGGAPDVDTGGKPIYTRWYLWGGLAVGFGAAGTFFGLRAKSAEDDIAELNQRTQDAPFSVDFSEAKEIEDRAKQNALIANINFAAAGAFAIVGTIFLVRDLMAGPADAEATVIAPVPLPGGAGVAFSGSF